MSMTTIIKDLKSNWLVLFVMLLSAVSVVSVKSQQLQQVETRVEKLEMRQDGIKEIVVEIRNDIKWLVKDLDKEDSK